MIYLFLLLGIILNFISPLATHLLIENNYFLKENRSKNWYYRYSFIILMRCCMTFSGLDKFAFFPIKEVINFTFEYFS